MMRTLFLQAPSFDGYDGGAGARYQMKREVKSFWYPTWIAQPAAMIEGSKLIDAPAHDQSWDDIAHEFDDRDLVILHTSTPSFNQDIRTARLIKERNPKIIVAFVGAKVMIEDKASLEACEAIDLVCREEYDFTCVEL
ncbi:cobalamin-dependent protein, partial [Escherichia coli]|uniref:cobalamin-dependent protein n=2 Tax=Pseudomonadota TaxID=1224 RepID=UPI001915CDAD